MWGSRPLEGYEPARRAWRGSGVEREKCFDVLAYPKQAAAKLAGHREFWGLAHTPESRAAATEQVAKLFTGHEGVVRHFVILLGDGWNHCANLQMIFGALSDNILVGIEFSQLKQ